MLLLQKVLFQINAKTRDTAFFVHESDDDDGTLEISVEVSCQKNNFEDESVSPYIVINPTKTYAKALTELAGQCFEVKDVKTADEREDTFYLYEHEPLVEYKLEILAVEESKVHIKCIGTAIIDGYTTPYRTAEFDLNCWLPIITGVADWKKYGL